MNIKVPAELLPIDGRFGCGPAKIRTDALTHLGTTTDLLGTSHRQPAVCNLVGKIQEQLLHLYDAPDGHQVVLGNGGATTFWDVAVCSLIEHRAAFGVFGEFGQKFAAEAAKAPFLTTQVTAAEPGCLALPEPDDSCDVYAWPQNETSTGVAAPVQRVGDSDALILIDATSAAGGIRANLAQTDVYYFSPQKNFASDGGLWLSICSPAALERAERLTSSGRWVPDVLNLTLAAKYAAKQQTLNTPALATLFLLAEQLDWLIDKGGLDFAETRTHESSETLYTWAENNPLTTCFATPEGRSPVVGTIDFDDSVDAARLCQVARENGIIDIEPYRKLGRNQIRVGMFPSVEPADVVALTKSLDWLIARLTQE